MSLWNPMDLSKWTKLIASILNPVPPYMVQCTTSLVQTKGHVCSQLTMTLDKELWQDLWNQSVLLCILLSWGWQNKLPLTGWHIKEKLILTVLPFISLKSRCLQGSASSEGSKGGSFLASSSFWHCQHPWCYVARSCTTPVSACLHTASFSQSLCPNSIISKKTYFQVSHILRSQGLRIWGWGGHYLPHDSV